MQIEAFKNGSRMIFTIENDRIVNAESPTHPCFKPFLLVGALWSEVRERFIKQGFTIHGGS
jgi:hypothetical protein